MSARGSSRAGFAIPLLLTIIAVMALIAGGLLRLAHESALASRSGAVAIQARFAAEAGIREVVWQAYGSVPPLAGTGLVPGPRIRGTLAPGVEFLVAVRRAGRETYLVESEGVVAAGVARRRIGYALWQMEGAGRVGAAPAVVEAGGGVASSSAGAVDGSHMRSAPPAWGSVPCAPLQSTIDSLFPTGVLPAVAVWTPPVVPVLPSLGLAGSAEFAAVADRVLGPTVLALPSVTAGICDSTVATNLGAPADPTGPCGGLRPLAFRRGDLSFTGEGQGLLAVDGDLRLTVGSRYDGVVLVTGNLTLEAGSTIHGLVRAGGAVGIALGASVAGSGCAALAALNPLAGRVPSISVPQRPWIEPL